MSDIDRAILFYSGCPDGQYDSSVVLWLEELKSLRAELAALWKQEPEQEPFMFLAMRAGKVVAADRDDEVLFYARAGGLKVDEVVEVYRRPVAPVPPAAVVEVPLYERECLQCGGSTRSHEKWCSRYTTAPVAQKVPVSHVEAARKAKTITADICRAYPETAAAHINGLADLILAAAQAQEEPK